MLLKFIVIIIIASNNYVYFTDICRLWRLAEDLDYRDTLINLSHVYLFWTLHPHNHLLIISLHLLALFIFILLINLHI